MREVRKSVCEREYGCSCVRVLCGVCVCTCMACVCMCVCAHARAEIAQCGSRHEEFLPSIKICQLPVVCKADEYNIRWRKETEVTTGGGHCSVPRGPSQACRVPVTGPNKGALRLGQGSRSAGFPACLEQIQAVPNLIWALDGKGGKYR